MDYKLPNLCPHKDGDGLAFYKIFQRQKKLDENFFLDFSRPHNAIYTVWSVIWYRIASV